MNFLPREAGEDKKLKFDPEFDVAGNLFERRLIPIYAWLCA